MNLKRSNIVSNNRKACLAATFLIACFGFALAAGCDIESLTRPQQNSTTNVAPIIQTVDVIETVMTKDAFEATKFLGTLKPSRSIPLAFTQGGRIANINVVSGQQVDAGQVLATTDVAELESQQLAAQNSLKQARQQFASNQNSVDLRNQISELSRQLDAINREIEKATIKAPFAGTVVGRNIAVGQVVSAGMAVMDLVDEKSFSVEAKVATSIANGMVRGALVWVLIDGQPFRTKIATVLPTAKGASRTRMVTLNLGDDQPIEKLNSGDTVELRYWTQTGESGFWLPYSALQQQTTGLWSAMVVQGQGDDSIASVRTLEVVQLQDQLALVQGALQQGDRVIINGLNRIVPGQKIVANLIDQKIPTPGPDAIEPTGGDVDPPNFDPPNVGEQELPTSPPASSQESSP